MKSVRFLMVALLPLLLAACAAPTSTYAWKSPVNMPATAGTTNVVKKDVVVTGIVRDAITCQPIANINVLVFGWGLRKTDAQGFFRLVLPNNMRERPKELVIHSVLYEGSAILPTDTVSRVTLLAKRRSFKALAGECQQLADSVHVSPYAEPSLGLPGTQMAFLIMDSTAIQPRKLQTLNFRYGRDGFPREPFRLRIYRYNGPGQEPGEDLLTEGCVVTHAREGMVSIDLSSYQIQPHAVGNVFLPVAGFFVAFEWIVTEWRGMDLMDAYNPARPVLRPPCSFADTRTWVYVIGKGWHRATAAENCWPFYESALSVEVEPAPAKR